MLISPGVLEMTHKAPIPVPGPGEVVLKVRAALTCGTDVKTYLRGHPKIPLPSPLGHEFSGDIHSVGPDVQGWEPGMPVMAVHSAPCGVCLMCLRGRENLCSSTMDQKVLGAYADYIKLPAGIVEYNLYPKPDTLTYAEAAMLEPLSCVVHGLGLVRPDTDSALIIGAGPIGLLHLMLYKMEGRKVIVAGRSGVRLDTALALGADAVITDTSIDDLPWAVMEATDGNGVDVVIEATGKKEIWEAAPRLCRKGGTVLLFGGCPPGTMPMFDAARLHYDEITLSGVFHFTPADVRQSHDLLASGRLKVGRLITAERPLDDIRDALEDLIAGRAVKYAIIP